MSFDFNKDTSFVLGKTYVKYHFQNLSKPIVFLFSPADSEIPIENIRANIDPWGFSRIKELGLNVLSFTSLQPRNWYKHPVLNQYLKVQLPDMLPDFPERLGIGANVGGFGVSLYANALNCQRILLFSPISTLNQEHAPWENRFAQGLRGLNWTQGDIDGSTTRCPGQIIYDKQQMLDNSHAQRYGSQLERITARGLGENLYKHLQTMKLLDKVIDAFIENELTSHFFHTSLRRRRGYLDYYAGLLNHPSNRLTPARQTIIENRLLACVRKYAKDPQAIRYQDATLLRDLAIRIENEDLTLAEHLMSQAHQLRKGPFITKKLEAYRRALNRR
ncbi:hypothetical protein [Advenella sp. FME57]|uniref:hypothetical protein n=1 Tax=Advenella sp. FME57 TaxID=2742604 RepID=UPI0018679731|nr:hypothetical protein [Advenella sp. FME57]